MNIIFEKRYYNDPLELKPQTRLYSPLLGKDRHTAGLFTSSAAQPYATKPMLFLEPSLHPPSNNLGPVNCSLPEYPLMTVFL